MVPVQEQGCQQKAEVVVDQGIKDI